MSLILRPPTRIFESDADLRLRPWIGDKLVHAHYPQRPLRDQRGTYNVSSHATFNVGYGTYGLCYRLNRGGGTSQYVPIDAAALSIVHGDGRTVLIGFSTNDTLGALYALRNSGTGTPIFAMYVGFEGVGTTNGATRPLVRDLNSQIRYLTAGHRTVNDAKFHIWALRWDTGNRISTALDGRIFGTWSSTGALTASGTTTFTSNRQALGLDRQWEADGSPVAATRYLDCEIYFALAFSGDISDAALQGVTADPRALFEPDLHRSFHFFSAGGAFTLTAEGGSYAITGMAASLEAGRLVSAESGSYAITGTAAGLSKGAILSAESGTYAISGTAASLEVDRRLAADSGSYILSGTDASLEVGRRLSADSGSYTINGTDAGLIYSESDRVLTAESGSYSVSGTAASLEVGRRLAADSGTYTISGTDASLEIGRVLGAESGTYSISGTAAGLNKGNTLIAESGTYIISGTDATLLRDLLLNAEAGSYLISGTAATLLAGVAQNTAQLPEFTVSGALPVSEASIFEQVPEASVRQGVSETYLIQ